MKFKSCFVLQQPWRVEHSWTRKERTTSRAHAGANVSAWVGLLWGLGLIYTHVRALQGKIIGNHKTRRKRVNLKDTSKVWASSWPCLKTQMHRFQMFSYCCWSGELDNEVGWMPIQWMVNTALKPVWLFCANTCTELLKPSLFLLQINCIRTREGKTLRWLKLLSINHTVRMLSCTFISDQQMCKGTHSTQCMCWLTGSAY